MKIKDIIYREDAIKALHEEWDGGWMEVTGEWVADNCEAILNRLPSADRPQGEWIVHGEAPIYVKECSACGAKFFHHATEDLTPFCAMCGAKMKGADDECR